MKLKLFVLPLFLVVGLACKSDDKIGAISTEKSDGKPLEVGFFLPRGDPASGREAFLELRCTACHAVTGEDFPEPVASPSGPVTLGPAQARQPRAQLAESIVAPSHTIPEDMENVASGSLSRMGDYSYCMTVRQLVDLIAFIQSLDNEK